MQTFLPYASFAGSAAVLDDRRLGKQRVEVLQVLRALHLEGYGWSHHPAVLMWRGHTLALVAYGLAVVAEWCARGFGDTTSPNITEFARPGPVLAEAELPADALPSWLGREDLHRSHRCALVRKDPVRYAAVFPDADPAVPYLWPEPPAGPPDPGPLSAWVVRATTSHLLALFREEGFVGLPAAYAVPGSTPKQRRQAQRLREVVAPGDRVVVPDGGLLHAGVVTGPAEDREVAAVPYATRPVAWHGTVPREVLRRPYQLQDPQTVFALRGEDGLGGRHPGR